MEQDIDDRGESTKCLNLSDECEVAPSAESKTVTDDSTTPNTPAAATEADALVHSQQAEQHEEDINTNKENEDATCEPSTSSTTDPSSLALENSGGGETETSIALSTSNVIQVQTASSSNPVPASTSEPSTTPEDLILANNKVGGALCVFFTKSPFSDFAASPFIVGGRYYYTLEHFLQLQMLYAFGLFKLAAETIRIPDATDFRKQVKIGLRALIKDGVFDESTLTSWKSHNATVVVKRGCKAKFEQNFNLKKLLIHTGDRFLMFTNKHDRLLGVGMTEAELLHWIRKNDLTLEDLLNIYTGRIKRPKELGMNKLGLALMEVRAELIKQPSIIAEWNKLHKDELGFVTRATQPITDEDRDLLKQWQAGIAAVADNTQNGNSANDKAKEKQPELYDRTETALSFGRWFDEKPIVPPTTATPPPKYKLKQTHKDKDKHKKKDGSKDKKDDKPDKGGCAILAAVDVKVEPTSNHNENAQLSDGELNEDGDVLVEEAPVFQIIQSQGPRQSDPESSSSNPVPDQTRSAESIIAQTTQIDNPATETDPGMDCSDESANEQPVTQSANHDAARTVTQTVLAQSNTVPQALPNQPFAIPPPPVAPQLMSDSSQAQSTENVASNSMPPPTAPPQPLIPKKRRWDSGHEHLQMGQQIQNVNTTQTHTANANLVPLGAKRKMLADKSVDDGAFPMVDEPQMGYEQFEGSALERLQRMTTERPMINPFTVAANQLAAVDEDQSATCDVPALNTVTFHQPPYKRPPGRIYAMEPGEVPPPGVVMPPPDRPNEHAILLPPHCRPWIPEPLEPWYEEDPEARPAALPPELFPLPPCPDDVDPALWRQRFPGAPRRLPFVGEVVGAGKHPLHVRLPRVVQAPEQDPDLKRKVWEPAKNPVAEAIKEAKRYLKRLTVKYRLMSQSHIEEGADPSSRQRTANQRAAGLEPINTENAQDGLPQNVGEMLDRERENRPFAFAGHIDWEKLQLLGFVPPPIIGDPRAQMRNKRIVENFLCQFANREAALRHAANRWIRGAKLNMHGKYVNADEYDEEEEGEATDEPVDFAMCLEDNQPSDLWRPNKYRVETQVVFVDTARYDEYVRWYQREHGMAPLPGNTETERNDQLRQFYQQYQANLPHPAMKGDDFEESLASANFGNDDLYMNKNWGDYWAISRWRWAQWERRVERGDQAHVIDLTQESASDGVTMTGQPLKYEIVLKDEPIDLEDEQQQNANIADRNETSNTSENREEDADDSVVVQSVFVN